MAADNSRGFYRRLVRLPVSSLATLTRRAGIVTLAILLGFLVFGLWPFDFAPENRIGWLEDENGVQFNRQSVLDGEKTVDLGGMGRGSPLPASLSLELLLQSETSGTRNTYALLSLFDGEFPENLLLAQYRSTLLMRNVYIDSAGERRYRETGLSDALPKGRQRFLAVTCGPEGISYYLDGALAKSYPRLTLRSDSLRGRLLLGTTPRGASAWLGKLFGVAVFNHALPAADILRHYRLWTGNRAQDIASEPGVAALYLFDERGGRTVRDWSGARSDLTIPEHHLPLRRTLLLAPTQTLRLDFSIPGDVAVNILGFAPFGFFFFAWLRRIRPSSPFGNICVAVTAGTAVSAAIEITQAFLPARSSSITDIACNAAGAGIGILAAVIALRSSLFVLRYSRTAKSDER